MFNPKWLTELSMQTHKPYIHGTRLPLGISLIHTWAPTACDIWGISDQAQYTKRYIIYIY